MERARLHHCHREHREPLHHEQQRQRAARCARAAPAAERVKNQEPAHAHRRSVPGAARGREQPTTLRVPHARLRRRRRAAVELETLAALLRHRVRGRVRVRRTIHQSDNAVPGPRRHRALRRHAFVRRDVRQRLGHPLRDPPRPVQKAEPELRQLLRGVAARVQGDGLRQLARRPRGRAERHRPVVHLLLCAAHAHRRVRVRQPLLGRAHPRLLEGRAPNSKRRGAGARRHGRADRLRLADGAEQGGGGRGRPPGPRRRGQEEKGGEEEGEARRDVPLRLAVGGVGVGCGRSLYGWGWLSRIYVPANEPARFYTPRSQVRDREHQQQLAVRIAGAAAQPACRRGPREQRRDTQALVAGLAGRRRLRRHRNGG
mmetsp:Transcript_19244/g.59794  ORF Transcript_19244/g.59794 Transcript_19244/m.59794 type:complete len:372 (+) Transcript_19244:1259-2374(+)